MMFGFDLGGNPDDDDPLAKMNSELGPMNPPAPGRFGRLKYATAEKARQVAGQLDLDGIHRHPDKGPQGKTVYMPGTDHRKLNKELQKRGLEPTMVPGQSGGMDGGPMSSGKMGRGLGMGSPDGDAADTAPDEMDDLLPRMGSMGAPGGDVDEKPDDASDFALFGDSDDDGEMELYK